MLFSCGYFNKLSVDTTLSSTINKLGENSRVPIELTSLTDFEWDNYITLGCYQPPKAIAKKYNIDLSNISDDATLGDSKYVLIFLQNRKAIKICEIDGGISLTDTKLLKI